MAKQLKYRKGNACNTPNGECYKSKISMTAPNQAFTIEQLFLMHAKGTPVSVKHREPVYNGENYIPDPRGLDLTDAADLIKEQMAIVNEKKARLADIQKQSAEAKAEAIIQQRVNDQISKLNTPPTN